MKRISPLLIIIIFLFSLQNVNAQRFKGEVIAGVNLSQVDGDMVIGYKKVGVKAGLGAMLPFSWSKYNVKKNWAVSMEILYNQKGARQRQFGVFDSSDALFGVNMKYKLHLDYVSLPIMLHYYDRDIWSIAIGLQYSRLVNSKEIEFDVEREYQYTEVNDKGKIVDYDINPTTHDTIYRPKANDFCIFLDLRCRIWQQLKIGFRFEYSLNSMRTRHFQQSVYYNEQVRQQRNNSLSFYLVYMIGEKKNTQNKVKLRSEDRSYYY